jgi:hypothetical protein
MNNNVWLLIKEEDYYYDDKYYNIDVFETEEDAVRYLEEYTDILLYELESDYNDSIDEDDWTFEEAVEITKSSHGVTIFLDDRYYIYLEIEKKEVMKMGGN